ncbi:hypothetical protein LAJLEIBI_03033 [[Clostridium] hylemonae DSM 15053]|uniref:hypothetical protein n=1 Tax=[Clostridium] hylemonae TaxID=89153 RepID=UPI0011F00B24|nr:hypothetical protein [[Clostridium] hylemonae]QEK19002.1 hypothetical protein LAJLEIBI_03033 [[Clostridium] hylemonae DSM 15053]
MTKKKNIFLAARHYDIVCRMDLGKFSLGETRVPSPWKIVSRFAGTITESPEIQFQEPGAVAFLHM